VIGARAQPDDGDLARPLAARPRDRDVDVVDRIAAVDLVLGRTGPRRADPPRIGRPAVPVAAVAAVAAAVALLARLGLPAASGVAAAMAARLGATSIAGLLQASVEGVIAVGQWLGDVVVFGGKLVLLVRAVAEPLATPPVAALAAACLLVSVLATRCLVDLIQRDRRWVYADPI